MKSKWKDKYSLASETEKKSFVFLTVLEENHKEDKIC